MNKRFLATTIIAIALLFSQGGKFLVAAFCPHLQSAMASCNTKPAEHVMSHEDMGHMEMDSMEHEPASKPDPDAVALSQPTVPCPHCALHSSATSNTASLKETDAAKRSSDLSNPLTFSIAAAVSSSLVAVLTLRAHGPPGKTTPRHILINIFRI